MLLLVFRPKFDFATGYTYIWAGVVAEYAKRKGFSVIDVGGESATLDNFTTALSQNPDLVMIATHGATNRVVGQGFSDFLVSCQNDGMLKSRSVYVFACLSGQQLGKTMFDKGANFVIGYLPEFMWNVNPQYPPEQDPLALPFAEVAVEPMLAMIDGLSPKAIYDRTMKKYDEEFSKLSHDPSPDAAMAMNSLSNDRNGLIVYAPSGALAAARPSPLLLLALGGLGLGAFALSRKRGGKSGA